MIGDRFPALRLNHALGGAAIVFAALALWPWLMSLAPASRPRGAPEASAPPAVRTALSPLSSYTAIVERPLFAPSRRPPPGGQATLGPSIESRYRLLGVVSTGPSRKAFVAEGARRIEIGEGDTLDGWAVKEIGADRVVLTSASGEAVLKLSRAPAEPAKAQ